MLETLRAVPEHSLQLFHRSLLSSLQEEPKAWQQWEAAVALLCGMEDLPRALLAGGWDVPRLCLSPA